MSESPDNGKSELRQRVNAWLDDRIERFYAEVTYARRLVDDEHVSKEYYIRNTIEIILRLRMKRTIDALTIHYFTKTNPTLAKKWCEYTEDEMLHDEWFASDLYRLGLTREDIYGTKPMLSTKLLQGYFYYGLEHEGRPLASLCSSYFIEYCSIRTQPRWLDKFARQEGDTFVKGAQAHIRHDVDDDHTDFVWDVIQGFVQSESDETAMFDHFEAVYRLFCAFYAELYETTVAASAADDPSRLVTALAS